MSFDIVVQRFVAGEDAPALNGEGLRAFMAPHVVRAEFGENIAYGDGGAELYGWETVETGFMITHAHGNDIWDLLVRAAKVGGFVIIPAGCPIALIDPGQAHELPGELRGDTQVVSSGAELIAMVRRS